MRKALLEILRAPHSAEPLILYKFEQEESMQDGEENILEGVLLAAQSNKIYPIINGIPITLDSSFTQEFLRKHTEKISRDKTLSKFFFSLQGQSNWSFSAEWGYHFDANLTSTWGWTEKERIQQFFLEADIDPIECKGKFILDAGCGNGQLSEGLSTLGAIVMALDFSNSVFIAEKSRKCANVHFVQGDLQSPPFEPHTFDLVISNGVIHHSPSTYRTFVNVAKLVKPGGRFYLWLYRKPEKFLRRYFTYTAFDLMRMGVARLPSIPQKAAVKAFAAALMMLHKVRGRERKRSWQERVVLAYDSLTPRWRHYHTPLEVSSWFFENGFSHPTITHWDNPYGFGLVATKIPMKDTPGVNFGKANVTRRYWQ